MTFKKHGKSTIIINIINYAGSVQISSCLIKVIILKVYLNKDPHKCQTLVINVSFKFLVYRFILHLSPLLPPFDSLEFIY